MRVRAHKLMYIFIHSLRQFIQRHQLLLLLLFCGVLYITTSFWYVQYPSPPSGDEPHFLVISQTLIKYHSLDVMLDYKNGDYRSFYSIHLDPHVAYNQRGQLLPIHSIGAPLLWLLPYYLLGRLGAVLFISLISVLIIFNIYKFLLTMHTSRTYTLVVSLAFAMASPLYIYSHLIFIEPIGALICIYVLRKIFQENITLSDIIISSVLLGILPWIHIRFAMLEIPLFFALMYRIYLKNKRDNFKFYIYYLIPVTILFIVFEIYNYTIWGTLNPAANEINDNSKPFVVLPFKALLGVFFDQQYGLLLNFPMFIFLLSGVVLTFKKKYVNYNVLMLLLSLPYFLLFTTFKHWSGGWCPPARFILVLLPLYSFYVAYALEQMSNVVANLVFGLLTLYGLIYSWLSLEPTLLAFNNETGKNRALAHILLFNQHITDYLPSVFVPHQTNLFAIWGSICIGLTLLLLLYSRKNLRRSYEKRKRVESASKGEV
ncbi:MAG: hypothetical protein NVSMB33_14200 [Ktedonobacteraceae bacterium]